MKRAPLTVAVFGAGSAGEQALMRLEAKAFRHVRVAWVFDNDRAKWGRTLRGVEVAAPSKRRLASVARVLVASIHASDITAQLEETGAGAKVVYAVADLASRDATAPRAATRAEVEASTRPDLVARAASFIGPIASPRDRDRRARVACTICSNNYLAHAVTLAKSFLARHPDADFVICLADERTKVLPYPERRLPRLSIVAAGELGIAGFRAMAFGYSILELNTAVKPFLLEHLLRTLGYETVLYLDPDILVLTPLDDLFDALDTHDFAVTPHLTVPYADDRRPTVVDIMRAGVFNLGFFGVSARSSARPFLGWWQARVARECVVAPDRGYFVDQRWVDLLPALSPAVHVVRDPGCNVAYWNLHERRITWSRGAFRSGEHSLRFFHFSGIDIDAPSTVSRHQNRHTLPRRGALTDLFGLYRYLVYQHGHARWRRVPYGYGTFANGDPIPPLVREIYRSAGDRFGDPFRVGPRSFRRWLDAPDEGRTGLTNLEREAYRHRADLRSRFEHVDGEDRARYQLHLRRHCHALGLDRRLLAARGTLAQRGVSVSAGTDGPRQARPGINVAGYLDTESGVGELARSFVKVLRAVDWPHALVNVAQPWLRRGDRSVTRAGQGRPQHPISFLCVNAEAVDQVAATLGGGFFANRHNIGYWVWEQSVFPERWRRAFHWFDEVWVPSRFVLDAVSLRSPVPVVRIPPCIDVGQVSPLPRGRLGVDDETTVFAFVFDVNSFLERKNPMAVIDAYERAFDRRTRVAGRTALVLKATAAAGARESRALEALRRRAGEVHATLIEGYWPRARVLRLIASSTAYVSLHRAEGFGYTIAEAQALGVPVVATAYSGTTDLVAPPHAMPVAFHETRLDASVGPYDRGTTWATPDVDSAVEWLRFVHADRARAAALGRRARAFMQTHFSARAIAGLVEARLAGTSGMRQSRGVPTDGY
ncbi:MAG: glycosyltransferase [Vicinamibacteraceae bacterium]|nr:glycosyltransferase [Vicinamibacteraceae bacterium]